jgi:hypothetical protein
MDTYELDGRDARSCRECGYVDVPVRHEPERRNSESWDDAIERFLEQFADVTVARNDLPDEVTSNGSSETPSEAGTHGEGDPSEDVSDEESSEDVSDEESSEELSEAGSSEEPSGDEGSEESPDGEPSGEASVDDSPEEASATDD